MHAGLLPAAAFACLIASAALAQDDPDIDCSKPDTLPQQGMNFCAYQDFEAEDAALNAVWSGVRTHLRAQEKEFEGWKGWFEIALKGQRAWLAYRDAQCEAEGKSAEGGSMQPMLVAGCLARLTKARTAELKDMIAEY
jgi:uncharacterized protein YecT (DUF1311 family)